MHDPCAQLTEIGHALRGVEEGLNAVLEEYDPPGPGTLLCLLRDRLSWELGRLADLVRQPPQLLAHDHR